jgi:hypothetical protein
MNSRGPVWRQVTDLFAYVLLPVFSLVTTAAFSRRVLNRVSACDWLLSEDSERAYQGALKHQEIPDQRAWKQRWKQVELLDVRDLYMMLFGRTGSVMDEIDCPRDLEITRDRVMVGMHWGPAISILKLLSISGLGPAFPFRLPEPELRRSRPFYYLFCKLATRYLARTLGDRAVPVGGAGKVLQGMLEEPGSICVLMDAPPMEGRPAIIKQVLGSAARFNAGFPAMLADRQKEYVLYAMTLAADGSARKKLELEGPFKADNADRFLDQYAEFLNRHLAQDSPHWRIWRAEHQFWEQDSF